MPSIYSHAFSETGADIWWGVQCSKETYTSLLEQMGELSRCFVYLVNERGESVAVAVEGVHAQDQDMILAPDWIIERLGCAYGDTIRIECIDEPIEKANKVVLRPAKTSSTDSPIFVECLTEAFNKLGIIQRGTLSILLDPSLPEYHMFLVETLDPHGICFADGEVNIEFLPALDAEPEVPEAHEVAEVPILQNFPEEPIDFNTMFSLPQISTTTFVPFSGRGRRLG
jgi:hypothetical protein